MIKAEIIFDSISLDGQRLATFQLRYPRFIHAEFMTHRKFSRNASSSRAVPTAKLLEEVRDPELRAAPIFWGKNQPGMQAAEELTGLKRHIAKSNWALAAKHAADTAEFLSTMGAHKQIVNRILEPFTHINVVVTATEYMNFFGLRLDKNAQPEMRALAEAMWAAYQASTPDLLLPGEWHLPFVKNEDWHPTKEQYRGEHYDHASQSITYKAALSISVARCARVSYTSNETGKASTVDEDLKLYDRLLTGGHWSPFEHQATPMYVGHPDWDDRDWLGGNFTGWVQFRKTIRGEAVAPLPKEYAGCNDLRRCRNMLGVGEDRFGMSFACKVCDKTYYLDLTKDRA